MLKDDPGVLRFDMILMIVASSNGNGDGRRIREGVYEIGHFGASHYLPEYEHYPRLAINPYGVCDTIDQILTACPELETSERQFVVTVTPIRKSDQESEGGWRWHKWGQYIGKQKPTCEYLYDEPLIDEVLVYHIYEKMVKPC